MTKFQGATVQRTGKEMTMYWEAAGNKGNVSIYWSNDPDFKAEEGTLLAEVASNQRGYQFEFTDTEQRPYFLLVTEDGYKIRTAERVLFFEGMVNFRDLGGYLTADGRRTKWGKLFRSAAHDGLTARDMTYLRNIGLKTVVDYRSSVERGEHPDKEIAGISYYNIRPLEEAGATNILDVKMETAEDAVKALSQVNSNFMRSKHSLDAYRQLLLLVLEEGNLPLVQHCTAGKDRVGVGSATLLLALGVPEEAIMADYLLSNDNQISVDKLKMGGLGGGTLSEDKIAMFKALAMVHEEYLQAMLTEMKVQFGDTEGYLKQGLGLDDAQLAQMQAMFLE